MLKFVCQYCGAVNYVKRETGQGRAVNPDSPLSENEKAVLSIFQDDRWLTWISVKSELDARQIPHHGKFAYWKQISVQSALSNLVGRGLLKCERRGKFFVYKRI
jgi:predicted transcriptional regulator